MPELRWALLCRNAIDEPEIRGMTLNGVHNHIVSEGFPTKAVEPRYLITQWKGEIGNEFDLSSTIDFPNGNKISSDKVRVVFDRDFIMVRQNLVGMVFPTAGVYKFTISADDIPVYSFTVEAIQLPSR